MAAPSPARVQDDQQLANLTPTDDVLDPMSFEPPASWTADGQPTIRFPVKSRSRQGGLRLNLRERPGRRGARCTTTGPQAPRFTVEIELENSDEEAEEFNEPFYPDKMLALIDACEQEMTGDLFLPPHGLFRCKAESYQTREATEQRNTATMSITWVVDNEEEVDQGSFARSSARSSGRRLAEQAEFSEQESGTWDLSIANINELVSELEGVIALPETTAQDITSRTRIIRRASQRAQDAHSRGVNRTLDDPLNVTTLRRLVEIEDMAGRAEGEALRGRPKTTSFFVQKDRTLQSIALELGQDYAALLDLNQYRLEDPSFVESGTVIRVFEVAA